MYQQRIKYGTQTISLQRKAYLYQHAFWLFLLVLVGGLWTGCGSQVIVGPSRSDSINLPHSVWMVAEKSDEPGGYVEGDPFDAYWIAQNGELHRVTDHLDRNPEPAWSPDAKTVAFWVKSEPGDRFRYYLYTTDSSRIATSLLTKQGTNSSPLPVRWSPEGDRLVFLAGDNEDKHLYGINKDGANLVDLMETRISFNSHSYDWSPTREQIAVEVRLEGRSVLHLVQFDPEIDITPLISDQSDQLVSGSSPSWSPDGNRIAYFSTAGVAVIDLDTRAVKVLTSDYGYTNGPLVWSPDGKWIAFTARPDEEAFFKCENPDVAGAPSCLYLLASDGSFYTKLTPASYSSFDWSPDSKRLAFTLCNGIYTISTNGIPEPKQITTVQKGYMGAPQWSPDGSMILFTVGRVHVFPDSQLVDTLYAITADGSSRLTLTDASTNVHQHGWLDE